ncbi:hypothetical protein BJX99DRAFT_217353 [Aspergillus californicus]
MWSQFDVILNLLISQFLLYYIYCSYFFICFIERWRACRLRHQTTHRDSPTGRPLVDRTGKTPAIRQKARKPRKSQRLRGGLCRDSVGKVSVELTVDRG